MKRRKPYNKSYFAFGTITRITSSPSELNTRILKEIDEAFPIKSVDQHLSRGADFHFSILGARSFKL